MDHRGRNAKNFVWVISAVKNEESHSMTSLPMLSETVSKLSETVSD